MTKKIRISGLLLSLFVSLTLLFSGCGRTAIMTPTVEEIAERSAAAGFLAAKTKESGGFIAGASRSDNASEYAYLYDNALAVIALTQTGAQEYAEQIADAICFAQGHDRTFRDGRFRNAYIAGDPRSDSGRSIAAGKVTVRLPGFWQNGKWQEDSYTVSSFSGNMAWTILALVVVAENTSAQKRTEYLNAAMNAADFVLTLESKDGGFAAGYEGWDDAQTKLTYVSTEHNIALYAAFSALAFAASDTEQEKIEVYKKAADTAKKFVLSMYDEKQGCFYTGTTDDGKTVSDGVIPLDANSLSVLALGEELLDSYRPLAFVEERMAVGDGFDFGTGDLDGIWNEGTAQMAVCYHILNNVEKYDTVMAYLKTQTAEDGSIPAADRDGVSTGFAVAGSDLLWEYYNVQSIGATGWLSFAQLGRNPLIYVLEAGDVYEEETSKN